MSQKPFQKDVVVEQAGESTKVLQIQRAGT